MKIILTNSDLIFRKEKDYVDFELVWVNVNSTSGNHTYPDTPVDYSRPGVPRDLVIATDGVNLLPNIGEGVSSAGVILLWDANNDYIGYGDFNNTSLQNGVAVPNVLNLPAKYKNGAGTEIDKAAAIESASKYYIALSAASLGHVIAGKTLGVR